MASVTFDHATRTYPGAARPALDGLELTVEDGEFLVLVGPSGSGKSTALRMLAGLEDVSAGRILIGDRDVTHLPPRERDIAMVFQSYALYPHLDVENNIGFPLHLAKVPTDELRQRVLAAARLLDLEPYLKRKPKELSGGQRQRVAMGRAIVRDPQVFLLDEPLSNLDAKLRAQTRRAIALLQRRLRVTTVYVTHDQVEALTMGDRVAVLKDGVLQQLGAPGQLYSHPDNVFVAGFIGTPAMNLFAVTYADGAVCFGDLAYPVPQGQMSGVRDRVTVGVRPEHLQVSDQGLLVEVEVIEELGADAYVYGRALSTGEADKSVSLAPGQSADGDAGLQIVARVEADRLPEAGAVIRLAPKPNRLHLFDVDTGLRLTEQAEPAGARQQEPVSASGVTAGPSGRPEVVA